MAESIGSVLDALVDAWGAELVAENVKVFSAPVLIAEGGPEFVHIVSATLDEKVATDCGGREETWHVEGDIFVGPRTGTTTESAIRAARDRTQTILDIMETHVNDTYTGEGDVDVEFTGGNIAQGAVPEGRVIYRGFVLTVKIDKNP
jgi:hypothetical protein